MTPRFDLIGLVVQDLAATIAFYRRLGLDIPVGAESEPHVEAVLPGGLRIAFDTEEVIRSFNPDWSPTPGAGYQGHLKPWDAVWGQRYASVFDPDGNGVDLFATLS
jgi:catechol 2,3-dioxygenase-like lactoylglutathione lyase family enzyme